MAFVLSPEHPTHEAPDDPWINFSYPNIAILNVSRWKAECVKMSSKPGKTFDIDAAIEGCAIMTDVLWTLRSLVTTKIGERDTEGS